MVLLGSVVFTAPSSNATICFIVVLGIMFAGGHLNGVATADARRRRGDCLCASITCIPHLEWYDVRELVVHDWGARLTGWPGPGATVYGVLYSRVSAGLRPGWSFAGSSDVMIRLDDHCFCWSAALRWRRCWTRNSNGCAPARIPPPASLVALMGDSRRLFANQFFAHGRRLFSQRVLSHHLRHGKKPRSDSHLSEESQDQKRRRTRRTRGGNVFLGQPKDWIDRFGRHFYPTVHTHLSSGNEREILPWLKLSAEMDPNAN